LKFAATKCRRPVIITITATTTIKAATREKNKTKNVKREK